MRALLWLALSALCACAEVGAARAETAGTAVISGAIVFPAELPPAMRICAVPGSGEPPICVSSPAGGKQYRLEHLPPGDYQLVAKVAEGDRLRVGGHMQSVQCVRAPCPDLLATVSVAAAQQQAGIDINEFFVARADFPALP